MDPKATVGRRLPEAPPDAASLIADDEARFIEVNDQAVTLLHYRREELLQMKVFDITTEMQRPDALSLWKEFIKVGEQSGMYQARRADGRLVTVAFEAVANFRPGEHLSVLRPIGRTMGPSRSLDECPYERPFPPAFTSCPAYQPNLTYETDSDGHAMVPVWSCLNLVAARNPIGPGFYGACGVGDALARTRWLALARASTWKRIQELRMDCADLLGVPMTSLFMARAAIMPAAGRGPDAWERVARESRAAVDAFAGFVRRRAAEFQAVGIDPVELNRCFREGIEGFNRQTSVEGWAIPEELVRRYSPAIGAFMRPDIFAR